MVDLLRIWAILWPILWAKNREEGGTNFNRFEIEGFGFETSRCWNDRTYRIQIWCVFFDVLPYFRDFKRKLFCAGFMMLRSDRVFFFFFFFFQIVCISLYFETLNRSNLNVRTLISFEYKIYRRFAYVKMYVIKSIDLQISIRSSGLKNYWRKNFFPSTRRPFNVSKTGCIGDSIANLNEFVI